MTMSVDARDREPWVPFPWRFPGELAAALERLHARRNAGTGDRTGAPEVGSIGPANPGTSTTVFRNSRAGKPGRPRGAADAQRRKAKERVRAYRARRAASASVEVCP